jgi:hypothetical protein
VRQGPLSDQQRKELSSMLERIVDRAHGIYRMLDQHVEYHNLAERMGTPKEAVEYVCAAFQRELLAYQREHWDIDHDWIIFWAKTNPYVYN